MFTNRSIVQRISRAAAMGAGALVLLTACGGGDNSPAGHDMPAMRSDAPATTTAGAQPGESFNDADVMFAQMMIPHHQQAVEMAELAETRAADAEVRDLAAKIKAAQDPEIQTMRGWLKTWGRPESAGAMDHGMPGMMSGEEMNDLKTVKGAAFDKRFAQLMIAHHEGAIEMAQIEQAQGADTEAKALARGIETAQRAEVEQLRKIVDRL
ncbi:DUF305 domain-containing protein [Nonomuraea sp. NPDC048916]|uniref:DUF305 domain-containing protein n=1 Tax=Nonomuraea sp. NPDC048916 TaxID=3154232 RepID=UPI0033F4EF13